MWKETIVACIKAMSRNLPGETEKNHEKPQTIRSPGWDPNLGLRDYNAEVPNHPTATLGDAGSTVETMNVGTDTITVTRQRYKPGTFWT
jgi:hypothetical protein